MYCDECTEMYGLAGGIATTGGSTVEAIVNGNPTVFYNVIGASQADGYRTLFTTAGNVRTDWNSWMNVPRPGTANTSSIVTPTREPANVTVQNATPTVPGGYFDRNMVVEKAVTPVQVQVDTIMPMPQDRQTDDVWTTESLVDQLNAAKPAGGGILAAIALAYLMR